MSATTVAATTFAALGEPSRLRIVELLRTGPLAVGEIAETLDIRQPQVSKHLKVLGESGLVSARPDARRRVYRLEPEPFDALEDWVHSFEALWSTRLDALGDLLSELSADTATETNTDTETQTDES